ncbi:aminotransferase class V-fold PLP-dependent enzyme [Flavisphingomonas formosensis]|uniref:aminotransferase class V-fold PLP-dependent enzyme n=1 Tax=Flavisphingomonas formosensis TaxID=861534 RepID=UPI0012F96AED|nr:aminotransferase class V-fold PLP-dependent enzyme [Sphingomonas formosensis]
MNISRRSLIGSTLAASLLSGANAGAALAQGRALPLKSDFNLGGVYLDSASGHPLSLPVLRAMQNYISVRFGEPEHSWHTTEVRDQAAALFARLINAAPTDIAIVPSTMIGENLIGASMGIGKGDRIVTDAFHYWASLAKYGEMRKDGVDVAVVAPRGNRMMPADVEAAITAGTRLVAVSLVASHSGFMHDLKQLCDIAHHRGALIYADIIQAAGAVPIDVKASGVDFACCGGHKWLQADRGAAFLYVRPEALPHLRRVQTGWLQLKDYQYHAFPNDPPGPPEGSWQMLPDSAASLFEVSTWSHSAVWCLRASISYILAIGVDRIAAHRRPLTSRLQAAMRDLGYVALTPPEQNSPIAAFARRDIDQRIVERCRSRRIAVSIGDNADYIRVSPSVFNDGDDIELFLEAVHV